MTTFNAHQPNTTRLRDLAARYHADDTIDQAITDEIVAALPTLLDQVDTLNRQIDCLAVDHEHDQRTIHDLEQQLRVAREDLAATVATGTGTWHGNELDRDDVDSWLLDELGLTEYPATLTDGA